MKTHNKALNVYNSHRLGLLAKNKEGFRSEQISSHKPQEVFDTVTDGRNKIVIVTDFPARLTLLP